MGESGRSDSPVEAPPVVIVWPCAAQIWPVKKSGTTGSGLAHRSAGTRTRWSRPAASRTVDSTTPLVEIPADRRVFTPRSRGRASRSVVEHAPVRVLRTSCVRRMGSSIRLLTPVVGTGGMSACSPRIC